MIAKLRRWLDLVRSEGRRFVLGWAIAVAVLALALMPGILIAWF